MTVRKNELGNSNLGKLCAVFPPYINCIGRNELLSVIPNVPVIALLSDDPEILTCFEFRAANVRDDTGAYFDGV